MVRRVDECISSWSAIWRCRMYPIGRRGLLMIFASCETVTQVQLHIWRFCEKCQVVDRRCNLFSVDKIRWWGIVNVYKQTASTDNFLMNSRKPCKQTERLCVCFIWKFTANSFQEVLNEFRFGSCPSLVSLPQKPEDVRAFARPNNSLARYAHAYSIAFDKWWILSRQYKRQMDRRYTYRVCF